MRKEASKGSLRGKFKRAGWDDAFLRQLLAAFWNAITLGHGVAIEVDGALLTGAGLSRPSWEALLAIFER
jgi:hypothetical protein